MRFRDHFRNEFVRRNHRTPDGPEIGIANKVRDWANAHPDAGETMCQAAMRAEHESGSILITLTLLLVIVELVYFIRKIRHGDSGEMECEADE